jgi:hypothetical protein
MKYINHKTLGILAFELRHNHKKIAELLGIQEEDIESAGFVMSVDLTGPHLKCAGSSISLNKHPSERDTKILNANVKTAEVCGA